MIYLLKREILVAKIPLLIALAFFTAGIVVGCYEVIVVGDAAFIYLINYFAVIVAVSLLSRPAIMDDKREVKSYLQLLPVSAAKIVGARALIINLLYLICTAIGSLVLHLLVNRLALDLPLMGFSASILNISLSLLAINGLLLGYYRFGAQSVQYVMIIVVLATAWSGKLIAGWSGPLLLLAPLPILVFCFFCFYLSCRTFGRRIN